MVVIFLILVRSDKLDRNENNQKQCTRLYCHPIILRFFSLGMVIVCLFACGNPLVPSPHSAASEHRQASWGSDPMSPATCKIPSKPQVKARRQRRLDLHTAALSCSARATPVHHKTSTSYTESRYTPTLTMRKCLTTHLPSPWAKQNQHLES